MRPDLSTVRARLRSSWWLALGAIVALGCGAPKEEATPPSAAASTGSAVIEVIDFEGGEIPEDVGTQEGMSEQEDQ